MKMASLFYSSNEKKQRKYIKDRQLEEINQANQQEIVDNALDKELGFEQKATKLSKLASRVIGKIGNEIVDDLEKTVHGTIDLSIKNFTDNKK